MLFRFEDRESQEMERSGGMLVIERPIHTDEEDALELIGAFSAFAMQAGDVAVHEATSCGLE
jgi:hypothetical protein